MRSDLVEIFDTADTGHTEEQESADNTTEFLTYDTDASGRQHERTPDLHDLPAPFPIQLIAIILIAGLLYPRQD